MFRTWAKYTRQRVYEECNQVRLFRKKLVLDHWTKYMDKQGHLLMKVIRGQSYHKQALMSKAMLGLYKFYLQ
jgi:hypothetical protein